MEVEESGVFMRENHDLSELLSHFDEGAGDAMRPPMKKVRLDAPRGQSIDVVREIRETVLPREDGYIDTLQERQQASQRPFGREYLQEQLTRWMTMEKQPYYQFIQLFAGASNCPVLDLMDRDDLERRLRERQQADIVMRKELERSIVPLKEKQDELVLVKQKETSMIRNQQTLRNNSATQNLAEIGVQLIDQCFVSLATALARLNVLLNKESYIEDPENETGFAGLKTDSLFDLLFPHSNLETDGDAESVTELKEIQKNGTATWQSLTKGGLKRRTLFRLYLDSNSNRNAKALEQCIKIGVEKNATRLANPDALNRSPQVKPENTNAESTTTSSSTTTTGQELTAMMDEKEERLQIQLVGTVFTKATVLTMTEWACAKEYGEYSVPNASMPYKEWAIKFINATDKDTLRDLGQQYNIFEEQPALVVELIRRATGGGRDERAIATARWVMTEHFLWLYFHGRSLAGLALDAYRQSDGAEVEKVLANLRQSLTEALNQAKPTLSLFFARVRYGLASEQTLQMDEHNERTPIVRLPYEVTELPPNASFDTQNDAMRGIDPIDMISDEDFRIYYTQGKSDYATTVVDDAAIQKPLDWLRRGSGLLERLYPVLSLYSLFRGYAAYERVYARHLSQRIKQQRETAQILEKKIDEISREVNSVSGEQRRSQYVQTRGFTAQPINSGIIKLETQAVTALDKAYRLVQQYCPGLANIGDETLTHSAESIQSGLGGDYARLAALVLAEIRLVFPDKYNTAHQLNYTLLTTTSALAALKRYRFTWYGNSLRINTIEVVATGQTMQSLIDRTARPGSISALLF